MLILGISTSSKDPSAAVSREGVLISSAVSSGGGSHSAVLMGLIDNAIHDAGIKLEELDAIAVDVGPGSFTGVRIGVSCANAMAMALGIPVIPVSSLAALRHAADESGTVCALIDCRNGNCYSALYENGVEKAAPAAEVTENVIASLPEDAGIVGDCFGQSEHPNAVLVLIEANKNGTTCKEAVPMYLRPSQAERMSAK